MTHQSVTLSRSAQVLPHAGDFTVLAKPAADGQHVTIFGKSNCQGVTVRVQGTIVLPSQRTRECIKLTVPWWEGDSVQLDIAS